MSDAYMWAALGKSLADAGSVMGSFLFKDLAATEDRNARLAARKEELILRLEDKAIAREEAESFKREMAALRGGGDGGGGKGSPGKVEDIAEKGKSEGWLARAAGMTVPELRAFRKISETGDYSAYEKDVSRLTRAPVEGADEYGDAISRKMSELKEVKVKELPPGFKEFVRDKNKALSEIEESWVLRGTYDDVMGGRLKGFHLKAGQEAAASPDKAGILGTAVAVSEGKPLVDIKGDTKFQQYTGESETTPKGRSAIEENLAQAAAAAKSGGDKEFQGLQQERISIDADLRRAQDAVKVLQKELPKGWREDVKELRAKISDLEEYKKGVMGRLRSFTENEGASKGRTPSPPGKRGVWDQSAGKIVWK